MVFFSLILFQSEMNMNRNLLYTHTIHRYTIMILFGKFILFVVRNLHRSIQNDVKSTCISIKRDCDVLRIESKTMNLYAKMKKKKKIKKLPCIMVRTAFFLYIALTSYTIKFCFLSFFCFI